MVNSTIKLKKKLCKCGCGNTDYIWAKGMIKQCYYRLNKPKPIPKVSEKIKSTINIKDEELEQWFKDREKDIVNAGGVCWECGDKIHKDYYRHATAHIFPKAIFNSVATNEFNFLILGASCGCHSRFDQSLEDASKMAIWKEAVERYLQFNHLITEKHKYKSLFESYAQKHISGSSKTVSN